MTSQAKPVCPACGGALLARDQGALVCTQHGHYYTGEVLTARLGADKAARLRALATAGTVVGRRCPADRTGLGAFTNPGRSVTFEGCPRCGGMWLDRAQLDGIVARNPAPAGASPADARALLGLAALNSCVTPQPARR